MTENHQETDRVSVRIGADLREPCIEEGCHRKCDGLYCEEHSNSIYTIRNR